MNSNPDAKKQDDGAQGPSSLNQIDVLYDEIFDVKRTLEALSVFVCGADGAAMRTCGMALSSPMSRVHEIRNALLREEEQADEALEA